MGWNIGLEKNTVEINNKIAKELFKIDENIWDSEEDVIYQNRLSFNPEHSEHMDYMWNEKVQNILKKHKVEGQICFTSNEGDNSGEAWGYEFDGQGNMFKIKGIIQWQRV